MISLPELIQFLEPKRFVTGFRLGQHNVTLDITTIPDHRHAVWCKSHLDILHCLLFRHRSRVTDRQTDIQTDIQTDRELQ